ncbi:MAG: hypothetical protein EHM58_08890 [Ignavibacteriae bacterium]|nr:MAG: hypothetical protein EHM58_08890 [Ignavibacteriota bacterium]
MDKTTLVENKITAGQELLDGLKKEDIKIHDALWIYDNDDGYWKFIVTSPMVKTDGPLKLYKILDKIIRNKKINQLIYDSVTVMEPDNKTIKMLRNAYNVRNKFFKDISMKDSYIYFMNA